MTRLELNDSLMSMAMKMSDGNPGALAEAKRRLEEED
jgi:hypothetical protein